MSLSICVLLTAIPGREVLLAQYEDRVLDLLPDYGARVEVRVSALDGPFTEIQILEFPSQQGNGRLPDGPATLGPDRDPERGDRFDDGDPG
jgi:hypothetical protein